MQSFFLRCFCWHCGTRICGWHADGNEFYCPRACTVYCGLWSRCVSVCFAAPNWWILLIKCYKIYWAGRSLSPFQAFPLNSNANMEKFCIIIDRATVSSRSARSDRKRFHLNFFPLRLYRSKSAIDSVNWRAVFLYDLQSTMYFIVQCSDGNRILFIVVDMARAWSGRECNRFVGGIVLQWATGRCISISVFASSFHSPFAQFLRTDWIAMNSFSIQCFFFQNGKFEMNVAALKLPVAMKNKWKNAIFYIILRWYEFGPLFLFLFNDRFAGGWKHNNSRRHSARVGTERMTRDNDLLGYFARDCSRRFIWLVLFINSLQRLGSAIIWCTAVSISPFFMWNIKLPGHSVNVNMFHCYSITFRSVQFGLIKLWNTK